MILNNNNNNHKIPDDNGMCYAEPEETLTRITWHTHQKWQMTKHYIHSNSAKTKTCVKRTKAQKIKNTHARMHAQKALNKEGNRNKKV